MERAEPDGAVFLSIINQDFLPDLFK
jgi:hypothetical protein